MNINIKKKLLFNNKTYKNFNYVSAIIAAGAGFLYGYDISSMKLVFMMDAFRIYYGLATWNGVYRDIDGNVEISFNDFKQYRYLIDTDDNNFIEGVITAGQVFGAICGALIISYLGDRLGRRKAMIVTSLVFSLGAFLQVCSLHSYISLTIGRFIIGLSLGSFSVICPVYISELIPAKSRGEISYLYYMLMIVGIFFSGTINAIIFYKSDISSMKESIILRKNPSEPIDNTEWRLAFSIQTVISIFYSGLVFIIPKSPRWLCFDECNVEALQTMARIHNTTSLSDTKLQEEFDNIKNDAIINRAIGHSNYSELFIPSIRRRTFNIIFMNTIQQWTGITFFLCFQSRIFMNIGITEFESMVVLPIIVLFILSILAAFVCFSLVDRYGRKSLLLIGMLLMVVINIFNIFAFPYTSSSSSENKNLSATPFSPSTPLFTNFDNCQTEKKSSPILHDNDFGMDVDLFTDSCHKYVYHCYQSSNKISWDKDITEITKKFSEDFDLYVIFNDICDKAMDSKSISIISGLSNASLLFFISIYISTWLPVPFIYKAEIFPIRIRTKGSAIGTLTNRINNLIFMILCPYLYNLWGSKICILFSINCFIGSLFSIVACVECKGISLEKMEEKMSGLSNASLLFFISIYISTWLPVPFIYKAEIFPIRIRTKGSAIGTLTNRINNLIFMILCPYLYNLWGSKICILFSINCFIGSLFSIVACVECKGISLEKMEEKMSGLSNASLLFFISIYISTWLPVPFIYKAEIFPIRIRTKGSAIGTLTNRINNLIFMILCPYLYNLWGSKICILFSINCFVGSLFSIVACVECKGISLEKMEEKMSGKIIEF